MKLRGKLALTAALVAVPFVLGYLSWRTGTFVRVATGFIRESVEARMTAGGRAECEADPAGFSLIVVPIRGPTDDFDRAPSGRDRPLAAPIIVHAYGPDFASANRRAPRFPAALRATLEGGAEIASRRVSIGGEDTLEVGLATPGRTGPCAYLLAHNPVPLAATTDRRNITSAAAICGLLLGVMMLVAAPLVHRIRRLTAAVQAAAAARYATPIEARGDDEIAELARAFNAAGAELRSHAARAEDREATLRSLVANTTHDAATPLTVLQSHLGSLRRQLEAGESARPELVLSSLEEAHYMTSLLQNLGAAAKLASLDGARLPLERAEVDLGRLAQRVVGRLRTIAKQREVTVDAILPGEVVNVAGDETLLEQAVSNIVQNAVVYASRGGSAAVLVGANGGARPTFSLRVVDDGPGVPEADLPRILERSYRAAATRDRNPGGLGLGLSITRDVVQRHGFTIDLRNAKGGGLEVEIKGERTPPSPPPR